MSIARKERDVLILKLVVKMAEATNGLLVRDDVTYDEQMAMIYLAVSEYLGGVYAAVYLGCDMTMPIGEKISRDMVFIAEMVTKNALELMDEAKAPTAGVVH